METPAETRGNTALAHVARQLDKHGHAKVFFLPLTVLAAVGGALGLLGDNWVLLVIVLALCVSPILGLFWAVERERYRRRGSELTALRTEFETFRGEQTIHAETLRTQQAKHAAQLDRHRAELQSLQDVIASVNWAVQRLVVLW